MKCWVELHRVQSAIVEIEVPDEATGDEIEQKARESVTEWKNLDNGYIEYFEDLTQYEETPSL